MRISISFISKLVFVLWIFGLIIVWFSKYKFTFNNFNFFSDKTSEIELIIRNNFDKYGYNSFASDLFGVSRALPDPRPTGCQIKQENLPKTSVIISFHEEYYSVLIRTIRSILENSPPDLLQEIILVDDSSVDEELLNSLEDYLKQEPKVKLIHLEERNGLARSRMVGTKYSTAEVLTFIDSNCECPKGWLEPLLQEIKINKNAVVSPVLDVIDPNTFEYTTTKRTFAGGFNWNLKFKWLAIPQNDDNDNTAAVSVPILPGGVFSISSSFFLTLQGFDDEFQYMGGEILEMSFKIWMCGGVVKVVPCSHVGHVFRTIIPDSLLPDDDSLKYNLLRVAVAWMDDYAVYFYERSRLHRVKKPDVSKQLRLREQLKCHTFEWYLKNVYPGLYVPKESNERGQIRNYEFNICVTGHINPYKVYNPITFDAYCTRSEENFWLLTTDGQIRQDDFCFQQNKEKVLLRLCTGNEFQRWTWNATTQKITPRTDTSRCLGVFLNEEENERELGVKKCDTKYFGTTWIFEMFLY